MPVLRQRETVRPNFDYRPVTAGDNPMIAGLQRTAGMMAQKASDYARALAVSAEVEGKALALGASLSTGPDGTPNLPPNPTARMGEIARRTYDATMFDRVVQQSGIRMAAEMQDALNRNRYNPAGFQSEADQIAAKYRDANPQAGGAIDDASQSIATRLGSQQGNDMRELQLAQMRQGESTRQQTATSAVVDLLINGKTEEAEAAYQKELSLLYATKPEIMSPGEQAQAVENLRFSTSWWRMATEQKVDLADPYQLDDLAQRMRTGSDPELNKYFQRPDGTTDLVMMSKAADEVGIYQAKAQNRARELAAQDAQVAKINFAMSGGAPKTAENQQALSAGLGNMRFRSTGRVGPMQPQDWLAMSGPERASSMQVLKDAGMADASLTAVIKQMEGVTDGATLAAGFTLIRDMKEQQNGQGAVIDISDGIGAQMEAEYQIWNAQVGSGNPTDQDKITAAQNAQASYSQIQQMQWDDGKLAAKLNQSGATLGGFGKTINWLTGTTMAGVPSTAATARGDMAGLVNNMFADLDVIPSDTERAEALRLFEMRLQLNDTVDLATRSVSKTFETRYAAQLSMDGMRNSYAPEVAYPDNRFQTFSELNLAAGMEGWVVIDKAKQSAMEAGNIFFPNALFKYRYSTGNEWMRHGKFEQIANVQVQDMIMATGDPSLRRAFVTGGVTPDGFYNYGDGHFLELGVDYTLLAQGTNSLGKPIYRVSMKQAGGNAYILPGTLDVSSEYEAYSNMELAVGQQAQLEKAWADKAARGLNDEEKLQWLKFKFMGGGPPQ